MVKRFPRYRHLILLAVAISLCVPSAVAEIQDPFDPFDRAPSTLDAESDKDKSAEELILDGALLLDQDRPLDARTKFLRALEKDPKQHRAHFMLSSYYLIQVGHFRLSLKYAKQAQALFEEKYGDPPYFDPLVQQEHAQLLYLLSQIKLNLDNYQGALDVLDEFSSFRYYSSWYPGSRAWVLMKLGRLQEAISVARLGVIAGSEPGRTLNMLGILLSMNGDRDQSLDVFKQAVSYEMSLGKLGQPATPLNNSGEVYKETFKEDLAEASWLKATSLPDGCEHVLPSLNLALLYIEQQNYKGASQTIDRFESCVAQFPLRNGEEHKALVHLARGRIALHTGKVDEAIEHFEEALERRQWFGKIGTSQEDLLAAALISLGQALDRKNNVLSLTPSFSFEETLARVKERTTNSLRAWWLLRRAREVLIENLNNLEDLYVRNTDSLIEYPTLGEILSELPTRAIEKRIELERVGDNRKEALTYYNAFLGEALLGTFRSDKGMQLVTGSINESRDRYDSLLKTHLMLTRMKSLDPSSDEYSSLSAEVFKLARSELRNYGLQLPINFSGTDDSTIVEYLSDGPFYIDNSREHHFSINYSKDGDEHVLQFNSLTGVLGNIKVKGSDFERVLTKFIDSIFVQEITSR